MIIKVLIIASGDLWAGAEAVVYNLAKSLKIQTSVSLMVVLLNNGRLATFLKKQGIETCVIDETKYSFIQILYQFAGIAGKFRPHVIHSHRYKENILALLAKPLGGGTRFITTVHGLSEGPSKLKTRLLSRINQLLLRLFFDRIVAVSDDIRSFFINERSFPEDKVIRIYNGIDIPSVNQKKQRKDKTVTIGSAGRFVPVKDYFLMVDIASKLCSRRKDIKFILAGDGPERKNIESRIKACEIDDNFLLIGHVDDMSKFYAAIDIYLNTSLHEGIPVTILEAMSYSIPVVAPDVGGLPEVIAHDKTGFLVRKRNAAEFAGVIENMIGNNESLKTLGQNARNRFEHFFSNNHMAKSYLELYESLANIKHLPMT